MTSSKISLTREHLPRSFRDRGLLLPFTTPILQGARLRQTASYFEITRADGNELADKVIAHDFMLARPPPSSKLELIVPNLSGTAGVYIMPFAGMCDFCNPSMHDVTLWRLIAAELAPVDAVLTPACILAMARKAALQGLAGRKAAQAAKNAIDEREQALAATRKTMMFLLIEQMEASGHIPAIAGRALLQQALPAELEQRWNLTLKAAEAISGRAESAIKGALRGLAEYFIDIGIGSQQAAGRFQRLVTDMERLQSDMVPWTQGYGMRPRYMLDVDEQARTAAARNPGDYNARDAQTIAVAAEVTTRLANMLLDDARRLGEGMMTSVETMLHAPVPLAARCERPGWLLDGWEQACVIWKSAPTLMSHSLALHEIARQLPILPDEAAQWLGLPSGASEQIFPRQIYATTAPARDAPAANMISRNEQLRAMTL